MITILLDQNSAVASLGQQAIITVVSMLRENDMKDLIDSEIHKGLIDGLMAIVDGKSKRPHFEDRRVSIDNEIERRRSSTPGFESTEDEFDQGEVSLAKVTCISVSFLTQNNKLSLCNWVLFFLQVSCVDCKYIGQRKMCRNLLADY